MFGYDKNSVSAPIPNFCKYHIVQSDVVVELKLQLKSNLSLVSWDPPEVNVYHWVVTWIDW